MTPTTSWLIELLDAAGAAPFGSSRRRQCPAHDDAAPSLSIADGNSGLTVLYCHAGCDTDAVLAALRLGWADLRSPPLRSARSHARTLNLAFPPLADQRRTGQRRTGRHFRLESLHEFGSHHVLERWRSPTTGGKRTFWATRDQTGALIPGLRDEQGQKLPVTQLPLYLEHDIRLAVAARERVVLVESESSVDALVRAGITATTWAGGATSPPLSRLADVLRHADVLLVPDNDPAGLECGRRLWQALGPVAAHLDWTLPQKDQDARDLLTCSGTRPFTKLGASYNG